MPDLLYAFPPLQSGLLFKRYKRSFADIQLAVGEVVTAHCPNMGLIKGYASWAIK